MTDMVDLISSGWFIANHNEASGTWWGSSSDGGRVAGSNHLYVGGNVRWVDADDLDMAPQHYDDTLIADFPNLW